MPGVMEAYTTSYSEGYLGADSVTRIMSRHNGTHEYWIEVWSQNVLADNTAIWWRSITPIFITVRYCHIYSHSCQETKFGHLGLLQLVIQEI